MSEDKDPITDFDLVAYADDKLDPDRAERVQAYLRERPELAARIADYAAQNRALKAAYEPVVQEELPPRLRNVAAGQPSRRVAARLAQAAAMAVMIVGTGVSGWMIGKSSEASDILVGPFAKGVAQQHDGFALAEKVAENEEFAPLRWLTQRVSLELKAPDLAKRGYQLVGRRKVDLNGEPAVQIVYRSPDGERLSMFLRRHWRETQPRIMTTDVGGHIVAYWLDGPILYGLTGNVRSQRLTDLAREIERELDIEPQVIPGRVQARETGTTSHAGLLSDPGSKE